MHKSPKTWVNFINVDLSDYFLFADLKTIASKNWNTWRIDLESNYVEYYN